jgi:hypothetical protein
VEVFPIIYPTKTRVLGGMCEVTLPGRVMETAIFLLGKLGRDI